LVDAPEVIQKKFRSAVTDSGRDVVAAPEKPALTNLLTIFSLVDGAGIGELEQRFAGAGYARFKEALSDAVIDRLAPIRRRFTELTDAPEELDRLLAEGARRAHGVAEATMSDVWARIGLGLRPGVKNAGVERSRDRVSR
jgi:tryptophanyl-tRNA synthetase